MKKIQFERVLIIGLAMAVVGGLQSAYDHVTLTSMFSQGTSEFYHFSTALLFNIASGLSGGVVAALTLNYIDARLRTKPYYQGLFILILVFMSVWAIRNLIEGLLLMGTDNPFQFSFDGTDVRNILFWMLIVVLSYFFLEMNNKFGPGKLLKIFLGRYNIPIEEDRIFMFLDLKSSTAIAEKLGGVSYHLLLKELFSDVTSPILKTGGEIYQYVGDEIVLSWPSNPFNNVMNCINCFFAIQKLLHQQNDKYLQLFGLTPQFKAGAHCGFVIAGEIGVIKRDITYSGDVLNTTARIQGMCNELKSDFLISESLFQSNTLTKSKWKFEPKGETALKGKKEPVRLLSVSII